MYALASLGLRRSAGGFCVAGAALGALQGVGCTPWRPLISAALPVAFVWQVRHLVLCKGSDVRPGVPWSPPVCRWLLRGRCGAWCSARGRMYALASLGLRRSAGGFCVAGAALGALHRGRVYALASLGPPPLCHYYHPTSHHTKIRSPHTHIHIRITSACTSHILQTASYTRHTYR